MDEKQLNDFIAFGKEIIELNTHYTDVAYHLTLTSEECEDRLVAFHYTAKDKHGNPVELGLELNQPTEVFPLWVREGVDQDDEPWFFVMDIEDFGDKDGQES